jgi:hypothetical protein
MPASALQKCGDDEERHLRRLATYRKYRRKLVLVGIAHWLSALTKGTAIRKSAATKPENVWPDCALRRQKHNERNTGRLRENIENGAQSYASPLFLIIFCLW